MFHRLYVHLVWTTRDRLPLLNAELAQFLPPLLRNIARQEKVHILELGMVATHVHVLVRLHPTTRISRLLQRLKGGSARLANDQLHLTGANRLRWDAGYSIHSISPRSIDRVREYLRRQADHHPEARIEGWPGDTPEDDVEDEPVKPEEAQTSLQ